MHLVMYRAGERDRIGALLDPAPGGGRHAVDLEAAFELARQTLPREVASRAFPASIVALIEAQAWALPVVRTLVSRAARLDARMRVDLQAVELLAPIPRPGRNIFCVGRNYAEHAAEGDRARGRSVAVPEFPQFFTKPPTAVIPSRAPVPHHADVTGELDYEVELAVVIGKRARDVARERAMDYVFGYSIVNDVTARDLQRRHGQWFKGKSLDGSCPFGPCIAHKSVWDHRAGAVIELRVNGEMRQRARTTDMLFDIETIIEILSRGMTLEPGDIIATGTPSGVGYAMTPPRYLQAGDLIEASIEGIGGLENRVQAV